MLPSKWLSMLLWLTMLFYWVAPVQSNTDRAIDTDSGKFEFALIGDMPYRIVDYWKFDNVINAINANERLEWVLHAGDIKPGIAPCSDALLLDRLERFQRFKIPFILTPGDNEWTDCHRAAAGSYQPLERLARLRELFYPQPGVSLGQKTMTMVSQASDSQYPEFVENVRWTKKRVLFATLHIVGSNNGLVPFASRTQADDDEVARRIAAVLSWLHQAIDEAEAIEARGIFLLFQADPRFTAAKGKPARHGFEEILEAFEQASLRFRKPIVLAHGDSHRFLIDKPLQVQESERTLEHVTRVVTFGDRDVHWLRVVVDPDAPEVFTIHPEIIERNVSGYPLF
ncbi:calcineurin-like phosphoesterase family protein [Nitrosomonas nitrosa]|uniref:Calcineurin-like phosphoesterase n=1 Tax=Nitrosomonas nitrosa TaxID=52442 RepID=A0A1I4MTY8_9PROT|nr:metallophosphoesterase [Nitrosomonas nitrosa]PTR02141.1 calcineurin-like phosphoesterase family protein [Nitrosomonas nitrosa]SFM06719.1 Calcineurin-like phosphoesterase [Nitrosomonas nitrosa]